MSGPVELSAATTVVGVIGDPVAHSLSPRLHNAAFAELGLDWVSVGFRVRSGEAPAALAGALALGVRGLSVTMPHKVAAFELATRCSPVADRLGAVNCLVAEDGGWSGENTDGAGFLDWIRRGAAFDPAGTRCLVVGAGGAARAVIAGLGSAGAAEVVVVNRDRDRGESAARLAGPVGRLGVVGEAAACDLVVNATPLGMAGAGSTPDLPVPPSFLHGGQVVVDLVYSPATTTWLAAAGARGAAVHNGIGMLVHQAAIQVTRWTGVEAPVGAMWLAAAGLADPEPGGD